MPKNWLFDTFSPKSHRGDKGDHVILISSAVKEAKTYYILDNNADFILCMLIDKSHSLTFSRTFKQFQIVKVTHDKIAEKKSQEG